MENQQNTQNYTEHHVKKRLYMCKHAYRRVHITCSTGGTPLRLQSVNLDFYTSKAPRGDLPQHDSRPHKKSTGDVRSARTQVEAKQDVQKLEETLSAGKQAALKTIARLETNAREQREEAAALREEMLADREAKMTALNGEVRVSCVYSSMIGGSVLVLGHCCWGRVIGREDPSPRFRTAVAVEFLS